MNQVLMGDPTQLNEGCVKHSNIIACLPSTSRIDQDSKLHMFVFRIKVQPTKMIIVEKEYVLST